MICGASEDEDERMKRSGLALMTSVLFAARERMAWCMVGTAVYQVGRTSAILVRRRGAVTPVVQQTWPPADKGANVPAIRPWIWNSGMILSPRSAFENASVCRI